MPRASSPPAAFTPASLAALVAVVALILVASWVLGARVFNPGAAERFCPRGAPACAPSPYEWPGPPGPLWAVKLSDLGDRGWATRDKVYNGNTASSVSQFMLRA